MRKVLAVFSILPLAACATAYGPGDVAEAPSSGSLCDAAAAQGHIGHDATEAMGAAILKDSGARTLRWGAPGAMWTMDYRQDRVNVRYDEAMTITEITCG